MLQFTDTILAQKRRRHIKVLYRMARQVHSCAIVYLNVVYYLPAYYSLEYELGFCHSIRFLGALEMTGEVKSLHGEQIIDTAERMK